MHRHLITLPLLVGALACSDAMGPGSSSPSHTMTVAFRSAAATEDAASAVRAPRFVSPSITLDDAEHTLVIDRAQLVVEELELELGDGNCPDDAADSASIDASAGCAELERGPILVDLPLTAGTSASIDVAVSEGTYHEIELEVRPVEHDDARAFLEAYPDFRGVSIRVDGTFDGAPFTYTTALRGEIETEFETPLVVDQSGMNVTVSVDLARWFRSSTGGLIDPATAVVGGANELVVASNIRASFDAFEDDDRDGHDDHRGRH